jgi:hypothetical protein
MVMNKRIRELAKQSGLIQYESDGKMEEVEKFAELIVRQTMDYASRNWEHGHLLAEDLKVYFGVEE